MTTSIAFLRGINVGGHHKVPMADLREKLLEFGCLNPRTLLNSGNVAFETEHTDFEHLEQEMERYLSDCFGFPIPVILRSQKEVADLVGENPFASIMVHNDIRLYVTFLKNKPEKEIEVPYFSADHSFEIKVIRDKMILSVLDLSVSSSPKGMDELEKLFGKNLTTRNWNTVVKVSSI